MKTKAFLSISWQLLQPPTVKHSSMRAFDRRCSTGATIDSACWVWEVGTCYPKWIEASEESLDYPQRSFPLRLYWWCHDHPCYALALAHETIFTGLFYPSAATEFIVCQVFLHANSCLYFCCCLHCLVLPASFATVFFVLFSRLSPIFLQSILEKNNLQCLIPLLNQIL